MLKAIETKYNGYRFRSRTEARWAVFFDQLCEPWKYEPQGYVLQNGVAYLPDFYLPRQDCFVEIKGSIPTAPAIERAKLLAEGNDVAVAVFHGMPLERAGSYFNGYQHEIVLTYSRFLQGLAFSLSNDLRLQWKHAELVDALNAARGARFEFNERPFINQQIAA